MNTEEKLGKIALNRLVDNMKKDVNKKVNAIKDFGYSKEEIDTKVAPIGEEYIRNLFSKEGDPSDPTPAPTLINAYTKEESDAKYSTKAELEAVRQEAFQSGSNTKKNLADKLTSVGVPNMSVSNTFEELISNIPSGKCGTIVANGTATSVSSTAPFTFANGGVEYRNYLDIPKSEIPFTPSHIMCISTIDGKQYVTIYINNPFILSNVIWSAYNTNEFSGLTSRYMIDGKINMDTLYRLPVTGKGVTYNWIAYE